MMKSLDDLPGGARCFLDANILAYHFVADPVLSPRCTALMRRIAVGEVTAFSSALAVSEALHHVMLADVQKQYAPLKPLAFIQRHPHLIATLTTYHTAAGSLGKLNVALLPVDFALLAEAAVWGAQFGLLTNDACTLALLRRHQLTDLVTNDDDFDRLPDITSWKPR